MVGAAQQAALRELFSPLRLQRIDDLSSKYRPGQTMSMTDLFDWSRDSIFGTIETGAVVKEGLIRRNLQMSYARLLASMVTLPFPGMPSDAQALARVGLEDLRHDTTVALQRSGVDELTRGHLEMLQTIADRALTAHALTFP
jgi:hypothetical protein